MVLIQIQYEQVCYGSWKLLNWIDVMIAWTGIEHFRMGRYDPPPPAEEPEDFVVCFLEHWFID